MHWDKEQCCVVRQRIVLCSETENSALQRDKEQYFVVRQRIVLCSETALSDCMTESQGHYQYCNLRVFLQIIIGGQLIFKKSYKSLRIYTKGITVPSKPCRAVVSVQLLTEHGQCFQSSLHARYIYLLFNGRKGYIGKTL